MERKFVSLEKTLNFLAKVEYEQKSKFVHPRFSTLLSRPLFIDGESTPF